MPFDIIPDPARRLAEPTKDTSEDRRGPSRTSAGHLIPVRASTDSSESDRRTAGPHSICLSPLSDAKANWLADYWDYSPTGHQGVIVLRSDTITDYTQLFTARIIASTALAPGGTCTLTIDSPAPAITYNSYQIYGTAGGASFVYRRYQVTNAAIAAQMTNYFPYPVAYRNSDGTAATLTSTPAGTAFYSPSGSPPYS